ncbi:MAG: YidC/Oxa1 family membrane protein insertase [Bacilli bacterium]|nr:YidC/Oxa1 family membrane protein insertase [Bacilli bacterium]
MKNKKTKFILLMLSILLLTGCTKNLKDSENKIVTNEKTGQSVTENIICRPTDEDMLKIYEDNNVDISKLPECKDFTPITDYEGLWTSFFVKPLAWVILKIGSLVKNNGLAIIITCLLIRCALIPVTRKTAMQSEMMKKAQPELERLEKKYAGKETTEDQQRKAQEMMMIYQKYKINPISGCLLAIIQLPLLFAFLEAINRTPAIFENKFLVFEMGTTVPKGIASGNYWYIILIILILGTTYLSFRKTLKDQSLSQQGGQMKFTLYFMLVIIAFASFSLPTALGLYWIASSTFTIVQNLLVERKKK